MGSDIAQVCAQSGKEVLLNDISRRSLEKGLKNISLSVGKFIEKGKLIPATDWNEYAVGD